MTQDWLSLTCRHRRLKPPDLMETVSYYHLKGWKMNARASRVTTKMMQTAKAAAPTEVGGRRVRPIPTGREFNKLRRDHAFSHISAWGSCF